MVMGLAQCASNPAAAAASISDAGTEFSNQCERTRAILRYRNDMAGALERCAEHLARIRVIVDEQDTLHLRLRNHRRRCWSHNRRACLGRKR